MKILLNWLVFLILIAGIYLLFRYPLKVRFPVMPGYMVILFSLSIAFVWVEILKIGVTKPLTCVHCMTGWISLIMAFFFHTPFWYFYLFAGLFTGAMWSAVKMRWL